MGHSSSKPKQKANSAPRVTATFPGDPDHGTVVVENPANAPKTSKRHRKKRIKCFMDIAIEGQPIGRIIFELRNDVKPRTCENFRSLCVGDLDYSYKGCKFHRIAPGFVLQTGDVELKGQPKEGKGGVSIYGRSFADEKLDRLCHDAYGVVSMANSGPHTNNSQFMILIDPKGADWLDGKHSVFGKISKESFTVLEEIEKCAEVFDRDDKQRARVIKTCIITDCGEL